MILLVNARDGWHVQGCDITAAVCCAIEIQPYRGIIGFLVAMSDLGMESWGLTENCQKSHVLGRGLLSSARHGFTFGGSSGASPQTKYYVHWHDVPEEGY